MLSTRRRKKKIYGGKNNKWKNRKRLASVRRKAKKKKRDSLDFELREIGICDKEKPKDSAEQICYVIRERLYFWRCLRTRHNDLLSFSRILSRFMEFRARTMPFVDSCLVEKSCNGVSRKHVAKGGVTFVA